MLYHERESKTTSALDQKSTRISGAILVRKGSIAVFSQPYWWTSNGRSPFTYEAEIDQDLAAFEEVVPRLRKPGRARPRICRRGLETERACVESGLATAFLALYS